MDTKLIGILKKLLGSQIISLQCLLKGNEKETNSSAEYHLSVVRKKEEKVKKVINSSNQNIVFDQEKAVKKKVERKDLLVEKKALVWDPRVQDKLLTANQLFNINQWLLSVENQQPDEMDGVEEGETASQDGEDAGVDSFDKMLDSF